MRERLEERLRELRAEFGNGERTLQELEEQAAAVRQTLLRISGAIQVLEEELGERAQPGGIASELSVEEGDEPGQQSATTTRRGPSTS